MLSGKVVIYSTTAWIKKILYKVSYKILYKVSYHPEPDSHGRSKIKVELDWPNYATKSEIRKAAGVNTLQFA